MPPTRLQLRDSANNSPPDNPSPTRLQPPVIPRLYLADLESAAPVPFCGLSVRFPDVCVNGVQPDSRSLVVAVAGLAFVGRIGTMGRDGRGI